MIMVDKETTANRVAEACQCRVVFSSEINLGAPLSRLHVLTVMKVILSSSCACGGRAAIDWFITVF